MIAASSRRATLEAGNAWARREDAFQDLLLGGSAFASVDTPLSPTFLGFGLTEGGERSLYLFVGQPF